MEMATKILISVVASGILCLAVLGYIKTLCWTWRSQIDTRETVKRYLSQKPELVQNVVTRDENKIYQDGNPVGDISGEVVENNNQIIFAQLANTSDFDRDKPFEYKRNRLRVIHIARTIGVKSVVSQSGPSVKHAVLEEVVCQKIE